MGKLVGIELVVVILWFVVVGTTTPDQCGQNPVHSLCVLTVIVELFTWNFCYLQCRSVVFMLFLVVFVIYNLLVVPVGCLSIPLPYALGSHVQCCCVVFMLFCCCLQLNAGYLLVACQQLFSMFSVVQCCCVVSKLFCCCLQLNAGYLLVACQQLFPSGQEPLSHDTHWLCLALMRYSPCHSVGHQPGPSSFPVPRVLAEPGGEPVIVYSLCFLEPLWRLPRG